MSEGIVCDLILLSWNQLSHLKRCVASIFSATEVPVRLIIVDNASETPVREYLATLRSRGAVREVEVIQNETNEGFPKGMNRGIVVSKAPFVCLLNNDIKVFSGWLDEMLAVAKADPGIGVLNPESNTFGNRPPAGVPLEEYAQKMRQQRGQYVEAGMCIGFCMLIRREVLDQIGGLSEEVERGFFEDEDFCIRAQKAGFRSVVVSAAYVEHAQGQSFKRVPERDAIFERNRQWCNAKWGKCIRIAWPHFESIQPGSEPLRVWLERLLSWARRRTYVYVYCTIPKSGKNALFRSVGLSPHADIVWHGIPAQLSRWAAVGCVLKRRKKRFDIVVAPDERWGRFMQNMRWLHGAEVVIESDEEMLKTQWKHRSHYPSLS